MAPPVGEQFGSSTFGGGSGGGSMVVGGIITGGTDTRVLFDDAGTVGEDADFTWNKTSNLLTVAGSVATPLATLTGSASGQTVATVTYTGSSRTFSIIDQAKINANGDFIIRSSGTGGALMFCRSDFSVNMVVDGGGAALGVNLGNGEVSASTIGAKGNMGVGATYALITAPTNGLIVEGITGMGTSAPTANVRLSLAASSVSTLNVSSDADNTTAAAGISFGLTRDTATFRSSAGVQRVQGTVTGAHVLQVQNTHNAGYSTCQFLDNTGTLQSQFGWANSGAAGVTATAYWYTVNGINIEIWAGGGNTVTFTSGGGMTFGTSAFNVVLPTGTGTQFGTAVGQKLAFHGSTAVIQRAGAAQAAVATTAATNTVPYGYAQAQADAIVTLLNEIRATLVEKGLMKGAA